MFTGVGRSPLSTEVFCAVIFLALAGVFWLYSFAEHPRTGLQRLVLAVIDGAIVAFVAAVAFAYDVDTIITWSLPLVPVALMLNALVGGPLIALVGFAAADGEGLRPPTSRAAEPAAKPVEASATVEPAAAQPVEASEAVEPAVGSAAEPAAGKRGAAQAGAAGRLPLPGALLCTVAAGTLVANGVVYGVLAGQLEPLANELASVAQLVPSLPACVAAFAVLGLAGVVAAFCGVRARNSRRRLVLLTAGAVLALAGIFVMRFVFYMTHLTAGLGV